MSTATTTNGTSTTLPINGEKLFRFRALGPLVPERNSGKPIHPTTFARWVLKGVRTAAGQVVRLEAVRVGHAWMTSAEAVSRFFDRLTAASLPTSENTSTPTPAARTSVSADASAQLDAQGLKG